MARIALAFSALALVSACATPQAVTPTPDTGAVMAEAARQRANVSSLQAGPSPRTPPGTAPGTVSAVESARRLYTIGDAVLIAGAPLCGEKLIPRLGMRTWSIDSLGPRTPPEIAPAYGLDHAIKVLSVSRGGPAARANLRAGDTIESIDGWKVPDGPEAARAYSEKLLEAVRRGGVIAFGYRRNGRAAIARFAPAQSCAYALHFANAPTLNAATDSRRIVVARGLVDLLEHDEQLAFVVGHELGHAVMDHRSARRANVTAGAIGGLALDIAAAVFGVNTGGAFTRLGGATGARAFSQEFEREADYVGLYFVTLAGFDHTRAAEAWRRMAAANPRSITYASTHPTTAERFVALESAAQEISGKLTRGEPLRPTMKMRPAATAAPAEPASSR